MAVSPKNATERSLNILDQYQPGNGMADELLDASGNVRPIWQPFVNFLSKQSEERIERRFERGNQYLRDAGVFFRQYDEAGSTERDWPLSHIPVLIEESEWQLISNGLIQRAELLESVVADLYGDNTLIANGHLPAELIAQSPQWLRPMVGIQPRLGHFLNFVAFEIGRGPDGTWWVLGDRAQAPSGAGFALENRVATSRIFSDFYAASNVHRLAGFFRNFRDTLNDISGERDCGVAILTPGRLNDTYFEHAYIARYLGFMLLEGEDLTVRDGQVMVRTVAGLEPISVLWRRMDAEYVDPLELNEYSILGTPGLMEAVRRGSVSLVNALGSGVLETRALLAFLPRICQALRGEQLLLPNIATWWCGQESERQHVLANEDDVMIGPALATTLPFEKNEMVALKDPERHQTLVNQLQHDGAMWVGQEAISLSTTPVYDQGKLIPRPMSLRVFLARTSSGWQVMPGGYARIGNDEGPTVIAMQGGGRVADVWIVSDHKVETVSMEPPPNKPFVRTLPEVLPSRAGDNLFWLGRYIERAESYMRMSRAYHIRLAETENSDAPLLKYLAKHLEFFDIDPTKGIPDALCSTISSATISASHIRDRFSMDGWMALNDLRHTATQLRDKAAPGDDCARALQVLLRKVSGFSGLVHDSMYHYTGWRFLSMGRALERSSDMAFTLAFLTDPAAPEGALDLAVEIADSIMAHRRRYVVSTNRETVVDLLVSDRLNPRSILYQLDEFREHLEYLPHDAAHAPMTELGRAALELHTSIAIRRPEKLTPLFLNQVHESILDLSALLSTSYLK